MSNIRSSGYVLRDPDDDESFQMLIGDVERHAIILANTVSVNDTIPISSGGTGANNAAQARINLGIDNTDGSSRYLEADNNLSDLGSAATARVNLGVAGYAYASESMSININSALTFAIAYSSATVNSPLSYDSANGRFTASTAGTYLIDLTVQVYSGGDNMTSNGPSIFLYKGSGTLISSVKNSAYTFGSALDLYWGMHLCGGVSLAAGEYITARWQGSISYTNAVINRSSITIRQVG